MAKKAKTSTAAPQQSSHPPLTAGDFHEVSQGGFNPAIRTSQAMLWFRDALVVGTGRRPLGFLGRYPGQVRKGDLRSGNRFVGRAEDHELEGAQVWRFDPSTSHWTHVYDSPLTEGRDGQQRARDRSVRAACIFQGRSDDEPALYLGVGSLEGQLVILRSKDGHHFEECAEHGLGLPEDADVPSVRCLAGLNGRLFTSPTGKNYDRGMLDDNMTDFPIVFASDDPFLGKWQPVSEPGFGDLNNLSVNELVAFNGALYAGTLNPLRGYQVWKTVARGKPPYRWQKLIDRGAWRGPASSIPASMFVYRNALYVGSGIQRQGRRGHDRYGPFPGELIRIHPDDSWDLVVGDPRPTPAGLKQPVSGLTAGFGDLFTHAFWRMAEYDGHLYLGTSDWRFLPTYLRNRDDLSPARLEYLQSETEAYVKGSFSFWCSPDGQDWSAVTRRGFNGNPNNYGIRELAASPHGLFVAPTATQPRSGGGGLEIWWGRSANQPTPGGA
jgi:hypothetical protein